MYLDFEQCQPVVQALEEGLMASQEALLALIPEAQGVLDELIQLEQFYQHYIKSFIALGIEMQRRQKYDEKIHQLVWSDASPVTKNLIAFSL